MDGVIDRDESNECLHWCYWHSIWSCVREQTNIQKVHWYPTANLRNIWKARKAEELHGRTMRHSLFWILGNCKSFLFFAHNRWHIKNMYTSDIDIYWPFIQACINIRHACFQAKGIKQNAIFLFKQAQLNRIMRGQGIQTNKYELLHAN